MMASIFSETRDTVAGAGVYFVPTPETSKELITKKLLLQSIISKREDLKDSPSTGAIEATSTENTFSFKMGKAGRSQTLDIVIKDYPGEYLTSQPEKVNKFITESSIVMVAIDTPYLMEDGGRYNESKNSVKLVTSFLKRNKDTIQGKMILLVPLKCERYFHDNHLNEMKSRVKQTYSELIAFCKENNVACIITPIQTLGDVEFDCFVDNPTKMGGLTKLSAYRYWKNPSLKDSPKYSPMFCVQPLYYLLTYAANQYEWMCVQNSSTWSRIKSTFVSFLKDDDEFLHEIKKMGGNIIHDQNGYEIVIQNLIFKLK